MVFEVRKLCFERAQMMAETAKERKRAETDQVSVQVEMDELRGAFPRRVNLYMPLFLPGRTSVWPIYTVLRGTLHSCSTPSRRHCDLICRWSLVVTSTRALLLRVCLMSP